MQTERMTEIQEECNTMAERLDEMVGEMQAASRFLRIDDEKPKEAAECITNAMLCVDDARGFSADILGDMIDALESYASEIKDDDNGA